MIEKQTQLACYNLLFNLSKKALDECKKEFNETLEKMFSNNSDVFKMVDLQDFNPNSKYNDDTIFVVTNNGDFVDNFLYTHNMFIPYGTTTTKTPLDKQDYDTQKRNFEIANLTGVKFTNSTINKIRKNESLLEAYPQFQDILSAIESGSDSFDIKTTFRINNKEASKIQDKSMILDIIETLSHQPLNQMAGLSILQQFGFSATQEMQEKLTQSQKDKLINLLTDDIFLRSDKDIKEKIDNMTLEEKADFIKSLSTLTSFTDNFIKANSELKDDNGFYSKSIEYSIGKEALKHDFKIDNIEQIAKDFDGLSLISDGSFEYSGEKSENRTYYIRNEIFDMLDKNDTKIQKYIEKKEEQQKILNKVEVSFGEKPTSSKHLAIKSKLKIK